MSNTPNYKLALDTAHLGLLILNRQSEVVYWNQWMTAHSGIDANQANGHTLTEIFPNTALKRIESSIASAIQKKQSSVLSLSLNKTLLPLFSMCDEGSPPIDHSIHIMPITCKDDDTQCLMQISDISSASKREKSLREKQTKIEQNEQRANAIVENISDALITLDSHLNIQDLNTAAHRMFGYSDEEIIGKPFTTLLHFDDVCSKAHCLSAREFHCTASHKSGRTFAGEFVRSQIDHGNKTRHIILVRDLSLRQQYEEALHREKEFAEITLHSITETVLTSDAKGIVNTANEAAKKLLGLEKTAIIDSPLTDIVVLETLGQRRNIKQALLKALEHGETTELDCSPILVLPNKEKIAISALISPLRAADGHIIGSVTVLQNVAAERRMQELLSHQATHDELTGLTNRREFERRLDDQLIRIQKDHSGSSVLMLDLDRFKIINDNCGHAAGDLLLRQLTQLLGQHVRNADTLARIGGDEFAVLLPGCNSDVSLRIAENLRNAVAEFRFNWKERNFTIGVSIGVVQLDHEWQNVAEVISAADSACLMAKESGRDRVVVYVPAGEEEQKRRGEIEWAGRIRESLEQDLFRLHCQPIVPVSPDVNPRWSCEVLIRMVDKQGNMVPPMAFIPAAERYDVMTHIDRWVVKTTMDFWEANPETYNAMDKVNINLSGQSLVNESFLDFVIDMVESKQHVPWKKVCFEITETAVVSNLDIAKNFISELRKRGCRFALDDFGSGLSSFAYLKHLEVDFLKIDGVFVKDIVTDKIDAAMVRSISEVGHAMQLETIAEFVENDDVMDELRKHSVDYAQGYGVCKPFPIEELPNYTPAHLQSKVSEAS